MFTFVTNKDLFDFLMSSGGIKNSDHFIKTLLDHIPSGVSENDLNVIKKFCRNYTSNLNTKWQSASRKDSVFDTNNKTWLDSKINWPVCETVDFSKIFNPETMDIQEKPQGLCQKQCASTSDFSANTPRERKAFEDLSNRQKKRRSASLSDHSEEELFLALISKLKENGNTVFAKVIENLSKNQEKVQAVSDFLFESTKISVPEDETLALVTALSLSKWQYLTLRSTLKDKDVVVFPSYQKLLVQKKECYPANEDITITESGVKIKLQAILDLTTKKILKTIDTDVNGGTFKLISKWGCDGASSQSCYKQKPSNSDIITEDSVFMASFVPLRLMFGDILVWENPRPSSTNLCRPIMFQFQKETTEYVREVEAAMAEEIANLIPTQIGTFEIFHDLHMTMIDGKVATALSETDSSATCNICLTTPKNMNNLEMVYNKPVSEDMYKYGLSSLHMWIRCMECILHISYNLDFKKWSARGEDSLLKKARKDLTQQEFFTVTGLLIDIVKQGFGSTNDGNTARRFFKDYEKSAEITGVDKNLIKRFAVILQAISSGRNIEIEKMRSYCKETAELYVHLYPWYYMPSSVHKLLVHGAAICQHFSFIPIGMMSEEASEARNKDFRSVREHHSRKIGRIQTNEDIIHNLLISSDPYITHIRPKFSKLQKKQLFAETEYILTDDNLVNEFEAEEEVFVNIENNPPPDPLA